MIRISEIDIYSESRSVLEAFTSLVPRHRAVAEIKIMLKLNGVKIPTHWIKAYVGHPDNKRADALVKAATGRPKVEVEVNLSICQSKKVLFSHETVANPLGLQ